MSELRQFKLTNGDEIICEVVEWDSDEISDVIVRNAMSIVSFEAQGDKYYTFRPWMVFQMDSEFFQSLNSNHIVAGALPAVSIVEQYTKAILIENKKEEKNIEHLMEKLKDQLMSIHEAGDLPDSSTSNVIQFNWDKDKMH